MKKVTPRIEKLIAANYRLGCSIREIADIIDLSYDTVRATLKREGVERRIGTPYLNTHHDDQIKKLYLDGSSTHEIAKQLDLAQTTVHRYLVRMKVPLRDRVEAIVMHHTERT